MQIDQIEFLTQHPKVKTARMRTEWLYTTERYPLYWHHIAKNGGTFFKNLLYVLDHDHAIDRTGPTHDWDDHLVRPRGVSRDEVRQSAHGIIIMRNPLHRFLSVYFDKVYHGGGARRPGVSREFLDTHDLHQSPDLSAEGHTENCLKLADWTALNFDGLTLAKPNWHLVPQMHQLAQVHDLEFKVLTLEDFNWQLVHVLSDLVPDIAVKIGMVGKSNRSRKPVRKSEVMTPDLKNRLKEIYDDDFRVFREVRQFWRDAKEAPADRHGEGAG